MTFAATHALTWNSINLVPVGPSLGSLYEFSPKLSAEVRDKLLYSDVMPDTLGRFLDRKMVHSDREARRAIVCSSYDSLPIQQTIGQFHSSAPEFVIAQRGTFAIYLKEASNDRVERVELDASQHQMLMIPAGIRHSIVPLSINACCTIIDRHEDQFYDRKFKRPTSIDLITSLERNRWQEPALFSSATLRAEKLPNPFKFCELRWMERRDLPAALDIEDASWEFPLDEDAFCRRLRPKNTFGIVAEYGDAVVGFLVFTKHSHTLEILDLAVHRNFRRAGIATQLVQNVIDRVSLQGLVGISVMMRETNLRGQLFMRSTGFLADKVLRNFYHDTGEDAYPMDWDLRRFVAAENVFVLAA